MSSRTLRAAESMVDMLRNNRKKATTLANSRTPMRRPPVPFLNLNTSKTGLNTTGATARTTIRPPTNQVMMRLSRETFRRWYWRAAPTRRVTAKTPPTMRSAIIRAPWPAG